MILSLLLAAAASSVSPLQTRCGWLHNPTPANWWLTDRDGQWILSSQGGRQAPGWEDLDMQSPPQWVKTNGYYGYGCACAAMRVDRRKSEVTEIRSLTPRPLKACRADRKLPKP
jgi:hypothetical protein